MTFVCEYCNNDTSSNHLVRYWAKDIKKIKTICPGCYYRQTGYHSREEETVSDTVLDRRWQIYYEYMKERMDYIQKNII